MFEYLQHLDKSLFLYLNGKHNRIFDVVMYWASDEFFWIPLYLGLTVFLFRKYKRVAWAILGCIALLITASDQLSSNLIKDWVRRPRPSHNPSLISDIHLSVAGPGGMYGFVSSHAANSFALAIFLLLTLPAEYRRLKHLLLAWALLVSYSRIYNGVHYPGDVIGGMLLGGLLAVVFHRLFQYFVSFYLLKRIKNEEHHPDSYRSSSSYHRRRGAKIEEF